MPTWQGLLLSRLESSGCDALGDEAQALIHRAGLCLYAIIPVRFRHDCPQRHRPETAGLCEFGMTTRLEDLCKEKGLKMTGQRRLIARVLSESTDHPDVETLFQRAARLDPNISIATVYRAVHLFEEIGALERHAFGDGKARYEERPESHHDHLIDMRSGAVVEFKNEAIERMQERVARELGYRLIGHRLELYAVPLGKTDKAKAAPPAKPARKAKAI